MSDREHQYIHQLFPKIRSAVTNMRVLAEKLSEKRTTLESRLKSRTGLLSLREQKALADAVGFKITWPEWRDPDASREASDENRRDTARRFLARFRRGPISLVVRVGESEPMLESFADLSLETSGQIHLRDDEPIPFFLEVKCAPCEVATGLSVGLAAFEVHIDLPRNAGAWRHNDAAPRREEFRVRAGDTRSGVFYAFTAERPPMRFHVNETAHALGVYEEASAGDVLRIEMRASLDQCVVERSRHRSIGVKREKIQNHLAKRHFLREPRHDEASIKLVGQILGIEKIP
jgi:hypothetical protein